MNNYSVVICTYNRRWILIGAIQSLLEQDYPPENFEIIVVDNGSTDDTEQAVSRLISERAPAPRIIYKHEAQIGLSYARNTAIKACNYDWVAFIDDDVVVTREWLADITKVLEDEPQVVCLSGKIDLLWDIPRPNWLPQELEGYLGCNSFLGNTRIEYPPEISLFGGNMVIRKDLAISVGGFDPNYGPSGNNIGADGTTSTVSQMRSYGKIIYSPDVLVYHRVLPQRLTWKYFVRRSYMQGIVNVKLAQQSYPMKKFRLFRSLLADLLFEIGDVFTILKRGLALDKPGVFAAFIFGISRLGQIKQKIALLLGRV